MTALLSSSPQVAAQDAAQDAARRRFHAAPQHFIGVHLSRFG
jgi:hypothetical protein